jgi:predicted enzyme related to lactoylglutathione lyase
MTTPRNFVWYELMTSDAAAAEAFYGKVVGWTAKDSGMPGGYYGLLSMGEAMIAGVMALTDELKAMGVPPCWTGYVGVDDVDGTVAAITAGGGKVHHPPTDIPNIGRFAVVADPYGGAFALFKPNAGNGAPPPQGARGHVGWHELYTDDLEGAFAFYAKLFGWTKADAIDMGPMGVYQLFAAGGAPIGGMMKRMPQIPVSCWNYYVNVESVHAAAERIAQGGGRVTNGPMEVPGGSWILNAVDPQGAFFSLASPGR